MKRNQLTIYLLSALLAILAVSLSVASGVVESPDARLDATKGSAVELVTSAGAPNESTQVEAVSTIRPLRPSVVSATGLVFILETTTAAVAIFLALACFRMDRAGGRKPFRQEAFH